MIRRERDRTGPFARQHMNSTRRISVKLNEATRDGNVEIHLLTNLPLKDTITGILTKECCMTCIETFYEASAYLISPRFSYDISNDNATQW